jgi:hypothetical protein
VSKLRRVISFGLLGLAAASLISMGAQAQQGQGMGKGMKGKMPTYAEFDLDGDGKIVEQEFNEAHAKRMSQMAAEGRQMKHVGEMPGFSGIDTNDDGVISEEEFAAHQAEHRAQMQQQKK